MDDDVRETLDRAGRGISFDEEAGLEDLARRRRARSRRTRVTALVVAGALVAGTVGGLVALLHEGGPSGRVAPGAASTPSAMASPGSAFQWCPSVAGTLSFTSTAAEDAGAAAIRFDRAVLDKDAAGIASLADPSAQADPSLWAATISPDGLHVTESSLAADGSYAELVSAGCGSEVLAASWHVEVTDSTGTASGGVAEYWLVLRDDGWKVWGSY